LSSPGVGSPDGTQVLFSLSHESASSHRRFSLFSNLTMTSTNTTASRTSRSRAFSSFSWRAALILILAGCSFKSYIFISAVAAPDDDAEHSSASSSSASYQNRRYRLDRDTASDCEDRVDDCRSTPNTYFECPVTCSESLKGPHLMVQGWANSPDTFFGILSRRSDGSPVEFEQFDGVITIIAAVPMLPGMAQFYYEMAEQLVANEPFRTACIVLPFRSTIEGVTDPSVELKLRENARCTVLQTYVAEHFENNNLVRYLDSVRRQQPESQIVVYDDKAIMFMVSHDARIVERRVTPAWDQMKAVLKHYYRHMDEEL